MQYKHVKITHATKYYLVWYNFNFWTENKYKLYWIIRVYKGLKTLKHINKFQITAMFARTKLDICLKLHWQAL